MTDEELEAIKAGLQLRGKTYDPDGEFWVSPTREQCLALVAEVERLRPQVRSYQFAESPAAQAALESEVARHQAKDAAMREIVQAVANARGGGTSGLYLTVPEDAEGNVDADYAWHLREKARALLGETEE